MSIDRDTLRSLKATCQHCRSSTLTLKKCSRCRSVFYCNATCQTSDWKSHKKYCVDYKEIRDKDALLSGGMDFVKYVDSWRSGSAPLFNLLIKAAIPISQKDTHALILFSDYRSDREGDFEYQGSTFLNPLVQIQRHEVLSLDEIRSMFGDLGQWIYENIMRNRSACLFSPRLLPRRSSKYSLIIIIIIIVVVVFVVVF